MIGVPSAAARRAAAAWLKERRVAVLKGGWSRERAVSLRTGAAVEASLGRLGIPAVSVDVDRRVLERLSARKIEFCFLALHGAFGEDGRIQSALDLLGVGYTGTDALSSAVAMDKDLSKKLFRSAGVSTPDWMTIPQAEWRRDPKAVRARLASWLHRGPLFVKPADQGSAIGAARLARPADIESGLAASFRAGDRAIVERFVSGRELTVGILGEAALPVVEIVPEHAFYDYHSKYAAGGSRHLVPAPLTSGLTRAVQKAALDAFRSIGCRVYGRVDVMLDAKSRPHVLEVNTIPGMTSTSLLPDAARAAGLDFDDLVLSIVSLSLAARPRRSHGRS